jgi:hypothetical protein
MTEERLNLLNDFLFMKYISEKGNEEQLIAFLNIVLRKTKRDSIVPAENRSLPINIKGDKSSKISFDVNLKRNVFFVEKIVGSAILAKENEGVKKFLKNSIDMIRNIHKSNKVGVELFLHICRFFFYSASKRDIVVFAKNK